MSPRLCSALLVAAAGAWAPEAEFAELHAAAPPTTWRGRVDAELDRSLNALPQRTTKDEASDAVAQLLDCSRPWRRKLDHLARSCGASRCST